MVKVMPSQSPIRAATAALRSRDVKRSGAGIRFMRPPREDTSAARPGAGCAEGTIQDSSCDLLEDGTPTVVGEAVDGGPAEPGGLRQLVDAVDPDDRPAERSGLVPGALQGGPPTA